MNFLNSFLVNVNGLFDFDLTFATEAFLFLIFSVIVSFVFISPISKLIDDRKEFVDYSLKKSILLLSFASEEFSKCLELIIEENTELSRQIQLVKNYLTKNLDEELIILQKENSKILSKLKGDLAIKASVMFSSAMSDINSFPEKFFKEKFQ